MASTQRRQRVPGGRYDLGALIGRGGMSEVYEARDRVLDRPVAVKVLRADVAQRPRARERLLHEARTAARLAHPHVVQVFDTGVDEDQPFIVMERLPGSTLRERITRGGLPVEEVLDVGLQVLDALGAAHSIGLVHRDVKPGNVLRDARGAWKVADFGIAKWIDAEGSLTQTGELLGSPSYLAPERLTGAEGSPRTDLYSAGVLLYEALAGQPPFAADTPWSLAAQIQDGAFVPIADRRSDSAGELAAAIARAMATDPGERFESASEMADALRAVTSTTSSEPEPARLAVRTNDTDARSGEANGAETKPLAESGDATRPLPAPKTPTASGPLFRLPRFHHARVDRRAGARVVAIAIGAVIVVALAIMAPWRAPDDPIGARPSGTSPAATGAERLDDALARLERTVRP
jgi:eukaryotic-like serine/threonine-protein kinase